MNENPPTPLTSEQVDELLSAELDGELASAAVDLGLDPDRVDDLLAASPGVDERRRDLAAARVAIATVEPLDELTAARLRSNALAAADDADDEEDAGGSRARRRVEWASVAALVAVAVVIFGVVGVTHKSSPTRTVADSSVRPQGAGAGTSHDNAAAPTPAHSSLSFTYGRFANSDVLAQSVLKSLKSLSSYAPGAGGSTFTTSNAAAADEDLTTNQYSDLAPVAGCENAARKAAAAKDAPVLTGTATLSHQPVQVFVYARDSSYTLVISGSNCQVVRRQAFPK
jgi:hypothetical protein